MRIAALYDVHGNLPALDAVLREVERDAADKIVIGGDVAWGPMPRETLDRLSGLGTRAHFIRGNTDRELVNHYDDASRLRETAGEDDVSVRRFDWAAKQITEEQRDFLASLPMTVVLEVDGLGPTLFCHGSPRSDEGIMTRLTPDEKLAEMLVGVTESVIVCGHTHVQFDRELKGKRVVNAGSVGMHREGRPGAYWLLLGPGVELKRTMYDVQEAAKRIRATGYPDPEELIDRLTADDPSIAQEASEISERAATDRG